MTHELQDQLIEAVRQLHNGASQVEVEDDSIEVAEQLQALAKSAGIEIEIQPAGGVGLRIKRLFQTKE